MCCAGLHTEGDLSGGDAHAFDCALLCFALLCARTPEAVLEMLGGPHLSVCLSISVCWLADTHLHLGSPLAAGTYVSCGACVLCGVAHVRYRYDTTAFSHSVWFMHFSWLSVSVLYMHYLALAQAVESERATYLGRRSWR
ncbi:uncharacterized protein IWZ02DRAFT_158435 [Phyllosticta citriasiana]|uniref:uncharacterized protein n=1 Tax=Phyllosticta citriasiana TaxID=595635 RepID=UPI0030FDB358